MAKLPPGYYESTNRIVTYKPDFPAAKWLKDWLVNRMDVVYSGPETPHPNNPYVYIPEQLDGMAKYRIAPENPGFDALGKTYYREKAIRYAGNPSLSTRIHERSHALFYNGDGGYWDNYQLKLIEQANPWKHMDKSILNTVTDFVGGVTNTLIGTGSLEDFYNRPNEIYARLMLFRLANNLNPKKIWTKQEIEQLKKNKKIKDFNLLDRYDSDFLLFLFNEVAQNNQLNKDDLLYARRGLKLIPRKRYIIK